MNDEQKQPRPRRVTAVRFLGALVLILTIGSGAQIYVDNQRAERQAQATDAIARCTKAYSDGFADAIEQRSNATAEAQNALDDFLNLVSSATPTQEGRDLVRRALDDYNGKRAKARKTQAEHPFPAPPRDLCR